MGGWRLRCPRCGFAGEEGRYYPFCPRCGGPLEFDGEPPRYGSLMGEGRTPYVARRTRLGTIKFKLEYVNPTGSFKDRGASYSVQLARDLGYGCVVEDSSGNAGISAAAYAAFAGLKAIVVVPASAAPSKKSLIRSLGAEVVEAPSRDEAARVAEGLSGRCFYVSHARSAAFLEGMKSVGAELGEDEDLRAVVVPSASFSLLLGVWRGLGGRGRRPALIAVQRVDNPTLAGYGVRVLAAGRGASASLADGLVLSSAPRAPEAANAVRESGGGLVLVSDEEIRRSLKELWSMGLVAEPTSAAAYAALQLLADNGYDVDGYTVLLTGSGLKFAADLPRLLGGTSS